MEATSVTQQSTCTRCSTPVWRADWDLLKECFQREQTLQHDMQRLVSQHTVDSQALHGQLTALQLTHFSTSAHLQQSEQRCDILYAENGSLRDQMDDLNTQYNHLFGRLAKGEREHSWTLERYHELLQTNRAQESVLAQQSAALESQAAETEAAHAAASKLGRMMNDLLSASDFASEAFGAAIEIADIMMQNRYQELTIQKLQHKIEDARIDADASAEPICCCCCSTPSLDRSSNPSTPPSTGAEHEDEEGQPSAEGEMMLVAGEEWVKIEDEGSIMGEPNNGNDQESGDMQTTSAQEAWSFYREQHPLRLDDYEP